jgi:hypothetical protein
LVHRIKDREFSLLQGIFYTLEASFGKLYEFWSCQAEAKIVE